MCYAKIPLANMSQPYSFNGIHDGSFNRFHTQSAIRFSTPITSKPAPVMEAKQESDKEYAERCIRSGLYTSALCQYKNNSSVYTLFFDKLYNKDKKLYRVGLHGSFDV